MLVIVYSNSLFHIEKSQLKANFQSYYSFKSQSAM